MKNMIEQLTDGIDKGIVNGIIEKAGKLNRNGQDKNTAAKKVDRRMAVLQIDKATNNVVARHESVQAAHRNTGVSDGSICYCCNGKKGFKTAGGFKWAYEKNWAEQAEEAK